ncbi:hypothetical protein V501_02601 [Pseudogymnoascus sp. VKM F-4519 (FW-2642)]|nr:hypothetical protein V501_02601 [Pseudogymnoascus sp. VKM F-4519 (FW-2642)]
MLPFTAPQRRRAGVVKCDLQQLPHGPCNNCKRKNKTCQVRNNRRKRTTHVNTPPFIASPNSTANLNEDETENDSDTMSPIPQREGLEDTNRPPAVAAAAPAAKSNNLMGYLGEQCMFSPSGLPQWSSSIPPPTFPTDISEGILQISGAAIIPSSSLIIALADAYFKHIYPHIPVLDRSDLDVQPLSPLLVQSLCLAGSALRHSNSSNRRIPHPDNFYNNVKLLLCINHEKDSTIILKSMCLLATRSSQVPTQISLDGTWHWIGVSIRYALNMGLHRESTYTNNKRAGICRRLWWHLFNTDKLQSAGYGRPPAISFHQFDTRMPTMEDFPTHHPDNEVFIYKTKLLVILGKITAAQYQYRLDCPPTLEEAMSIVGALKEWINGLPEDLRLYNGSVRRPYRRSTLELHIIYFVCVILINRFCEKPNRSWASLKTPIVAASCMASLFEEIYYRDEVIYMAPINNWFCMVASIPLIISIKLLPEKQSLFTENLATIKSVLEQMALRTPSSELILSSVNRVERAKNHEAENNATAPSLHTPTNMDHGDVQESPDFESFLLGSVEALFPFPNTLCASMDLLSIIQDGNNQDQALPAEHLVEISDWMFNVDFSDMQWDAFQMPFDMTDMPIMGME